MSLKCYKLFCIILGMIMIIAGLFLAIFNVMEGKNASDNSKTVLTQVKSLDDEQNAFVYPKEDETPDNLPPYILYPNMEMPVKTIDGYDYIGILKAPSIDMELPVMSRWDYDALKIAPCRYEGSVYLNNLIVCAHNYQKHFGQLKSLQIGDDITFTDMDGNIFYYYVVELETIQPAAVDDMEGGIWDLTLFTCTIGGTSRVTVRCELNQNNNYN